MSAAVRAPDVAGDIAPHRIPSELRERPQWVAWRYDMRTGATKPTKVPVDPRTGELASTTDPRTWGSFDAVRAACDRYNLDGIGFVFATSDPFVGIDLDACRDPATGQIHLAATAIIRALDSYAEVSPSGRGVHIFVQGALPPGRRKTGDTPWGGGFEVYDTGRYFTVTGDQIDGTPLAVAERPAQLRDLHTRLFPAPTRTSRCAAPRGFRRAAAPPRP